jgi:predicted lipoprotein with Yx(FWY)xxD motif
MIAVLLAAAVLSGGTVVSTAHNANVNATILVTAGGATIYEYESDFQGQTACTNDSVYHCSKHWLPLLTTGAPKAEGHAKQSLLGTVKRPDGTTQVTYKHRPLYTWKGGYSVRGDKRAGDVYGQGFAGLWYVLSANGAVIRN